MRTSTWIGFDAPMRVTSPYSTARSSRSCAGDDKVADYLARFKDALPPYFQHLLDRFGLGNLSGLRDKIVKSAMQGSEFFATQAFSFGQGTFQFLVSFFVMLYLLFFFLRDNI